MSEEIEIMSVKIPIMTKDAAIDRIESLLDSKKGVRVFTPNPEMLLAAKDSSALAQMLNSADLLLPDGIGVKIVSHMLGNPIPERISGIDMAFELLKIAETRRLSVFLLGGKPTVAERAAEKLVADLPSLNICGTHHGYFDKSGKENQAVAEQIRKAAPDLLFVCFGFPVQERWICENLDSLPSVSLAMGLGGSLDVWSGDKKRAPKLVQRLCLEWLWRASLEPKRLKIFIEIPRFLYLAAKK